MLLRRRRAPLLVIACLACLPAAAAAQSSIQEERIAASFVLALGRTPTPDEIQRWRAQDPVPLADYLLRHRRELQRDAAGRLAVLAKASLDAIGRAPSEEETRGMSGATTYVEFVQRHLGWLAGHPAEYEQVMHRAYRLLLNRDAYAVEIDYWIRQPVRSFALLVGCIEDWARRNRPGLMATTGVASVSVNSPYLATVRLSSGVVAEARAAAGLTLEGDAALASALGRSVVAPGAERVASVGGIAFVAAGAPALAPARGIQ